MLQDAHQRRFVSTALTDVRRASKKVAKGQHQQRPAGALQAHNTTTTGRGGSRPPTTTPLPPRKAARYRQKTARRRWRALTARPSVASTRRSPPKGNEKRRASPEVTGPPPEVGPTHSTPPPPRNTLGAKSIRAGCTGRCAARRARAAMSQGDRVTAPATTSGAKRARSSRQSQLVSQPPQHQQPTGTEDGAQQQPPRVDGKERWGGDLPQRERAKRPAPGEAGET